MAPLIPNICTTFRGMVSSCSGRVTPMERPFLSIDQVVGWTPDTVYSVSGREKTLSAVRNRAAIPRFSSP